MWRSLEEMTLLRRNGIGCRLCRSSCSCSRTEHEQEQELTTNRPILIHPANAYVALSPEGLTSPARRLQPLDHGRRLILPQPTEPIHGLPRPPPPGKPRERGWGMMSGPVAMRSPALKRPGWRRQALRAEGQSDTTPAHESAEGKYASTG